jgi:hypothetical protein
VAIAFWSGGWLVADTNSNGDSHCYRHTDSYCYCYCYGYTYCYRNSYRDPDIYAWLHSLGQFY